MKLLGLSKHFDYIVNIGIILGDYTEICKILNVSYNPSQLYSSYQKEPLYTYGTLSW